MHANPEADGPAPSPYSHPVWMGAIWLAGLVGVAIAQRLLDGHVNWGNLVGMAAGMAIGMGLLEAVRRIRRARYRS